MKDLANLFKKVGIRPIEFKKREKEELSKLNKLFSTSSDLRKFIKNKRYNEKQYAEKRNNIKFGYLYCSG